MNKRIVLKIIPLILILALCILTIPVSAQEPAEKSRQKAPNYYELLEKYGVVKATDIPQEEWPSIPERTHPELFGKEAIAERAAYYQAGIGTLPNETWYGICVWIKGNNIENDNPDYNFVRLTPHVCLKGSSDYIAVVLEATEDEDDLELWTYHHFGNPSFEYEGTVSKDSYYQYSLYIDSDNDFDILYRSNGGAWSYLRGGSMGGRESGISAFLEHAINSGSPGEHGQSYWEQFILWDSDGTGEYWDHSPYGFYTVPVRYYSGVAYGWNRWMVNWSSY